MTSAWPMYRAMVGVGLLCGVLIVTVFELTRPVIARNRAAALEAAVFDVLPGAASSYAFRRSPEGAFEPEAGGGEGSGGEVVYGGYDAGGRLVGVAIEGSGMGYQDTIRLLYGYSPAEQAIVGMRVLESKETPGLGDKIEKEENFRANFERLSAKLNPAGDGLENAIVAVKQGEKTETWQVDGITGATISSEAIARILNESARFWAPAIIARLTELEEEPR